MVTRKTSELEVHARNLGSYSQTLLKNIFFFFSKICKLYGLANQRLCYIEMFLKIKKKIWIIRQGMFKRMVGEYRARLTVNCIKNTRIQNDIVSKFKL